MDRTHVPHGWSSFWQEHRRDHKIYSVLVSFSPLVYGPKDSESLCKGVFCTPDSSIPFVPWHCMEYISIDKWHYLCRKNIRFLNILPNASQKWSIIPLLAGKSDCDLYCICSWLCYPFLSFVVLSQKDTRGNEKQVIVSYRLKWCIPSA